jgi:hypothetical protein
LFEKGGNQMNPQLPNTFDFLWIVAGALSLLPVATTVLLAFILREAVKIRRRLEKTNKDT